MQSPNEARFPSSLNSVNDRMMLGHQQIGKFLGQPYAASQTQSNSIPDNNMYKQQRDMPMQNVNFSQMSSGLRQQQIPSSQCSQLGTAIASNQSNMLRAPGQFQQYRPSQATHIPNQRSVQQEEEKRKFEEKRKHQQRQQKLKQFSKSGVRSSIDPDAFMKNMIGPTAPPRTNNSHRRATSMDHTKTEDDFGEFLCSSDTRSHVNVRAQNPSIAGNLSRSDDQHLASAENSESLNLRSTKTTGPKKGLESMMQECSDLRASKKAASFHQKKVVNEIQPSRTSTKIYSSSNKACDWSRLSNDVEQSFGVPVTVAKPTLPMWSSDRTALPAVYHQIESVVTTAAGNIDTGLLYPILVSSGLPQQLLAFIWTLANQTTPGQLTQHELYVALSLIAVAQAGHAFQSTDILNNLTEAPIPVFTSDARQPNNSEMQSSNREMDSTSKNPVNVGERPSSASSEIPSNVDRICTEGGSVASNVSSQAAEIKSFEDMQSFNYKKAMIDRSASSETNTGSTLLVMSSTITNADQQQHEENKDEDDFDDFVAAPASTQSANFNSLRIAGESKTKSDDDFSDFQGASADLDGGKREASDLMQVADDKYSALRVLGDFVTSDQCPASDESAYKRIASKELETQDADNFGDFISVSSANELAENSPVSHSNKDLGFKADFTNFECVANDDFGEFSCSIDQALDAPVTQNLNVKSQSASSLESGTFDGSASAKTTTSFGDTQSIASLDLEQGYLGADFKQSKKDSISLGENQSIASLEFGSFDTQCGRSSDSKSPVSKSGSTPSLDLKVTSGIDDNEFGEMISADHRETPNVAGPIDATTVLLQESNNAGLIVDKYSSVREHTMVDESRDEDDDKHGRQWHKCLRSCYDLLNTANSVFNSINSSSVCNEVLSTEEGSAYFKNIVEVYRVVRRVSLSVKSTNIRNDKIDQLLKDTNLVWNNLTAFIAGTSVMPEESSLDFTTGVISHHDQDRLVKTCGVCLLDVDSRSKAFDRQEDGYKLTYGGRQYHSSCANLWVNCVDSLLPALTIPHLL